MFLKPKHFIFECRPNFGSFCPLPGLLRAITFSAPKPPPLQISAYATARVHSKFSKSIKKRACSRDFKTDKTCRELSELSRSISPLLIVLNDFRET